MGLFSSSAIALSWEFISSVIILPRVAILNLLAELVCLCFLEPLPRVTSSLGHTLLAPLRLRILLLNITGFGTTRTSKLTAEMKQLLLAPFPDYHLRCLFSESRVFAIHPRHLVLGISLFLAVISICATFPQMLGS